eukprot:4594596-Alexandrium_andersonii.AAC.1
MSGEVGGGEGRRCRLSQGSFDSSQDRPGGSLDARLDHAHLRSRARAREAHKQVALREPRVCRVMKAQRVFEFRALTAGVRLREG